jgi:hypothetical protein
MTRLRRNSGKPHQVDAARAKRSINVVVRIDEDICWAHTRRREVKRRVEITRGPKNSF